MPQHLRTQCHHVQFLGQAKVALMQPHGISVIELNASTGIFSSVKTLPTRKMPKRPFLAAPVTMTASQCGRYIAVCNAWNDLMVFDLKKNKAASVPTESAALMGPMIFTCTAQSTSPVLIYSVFGKGSAQTRLRAFDVVSKKIHAQLDTFLSNIGWISQRKEKICGMAMHHSDDGQSPALFIWSHRWIGRLSLSVASESAAKNSEPEWSATTHFENVLGFGSLDASNEFVVVEKPWIDVIESMQPPIATKQYGI